jgi:uncharacterized protein YbcI
MSGPDDNGASLSRELANLVVHFTREYTGRGPTRARAYVHDDLISVVMQDTLTKGEQSLVDSGHVSHVLDTRRRYQATMRTDLVSGVEALTGRRVIAFMSDNHIDPDVAVETFVLEPREQPS